MESDSAYLVKRILQRYIEQYKREEGVLESGTWNELRHGLLLSTWRKASTSYDALLIILELWNICATWRWIIANYIGSSLFGVFLI